MSINTYKKTLSKNLLKFLIKKDILGLFFYCLMLYDKYYTPKEVIISIETMPSWLRINELLIEHTNNKSYIQWSMLARMYNNEIKNNTGRYEVITCFVSTNSSYNCLTCANFNNFLCNSFYFSKDIIEYNVPKNLHISYIQL